ncbi:MAG: hypothetical protein NZ957_02675 [Thaumarchaeota archaeon]|nr:hypothetical protein [Candidatus Calditenuaceae archaeon]
MVLTAKVFEVRAQSTLGAVARKLKDFRNVEAVKEDDSEVELITDVHDVRGERDRVSGVFSRDKLVRVRQRGKVVPVVKTVDAYIEFRDRGDKLLLVVMQEKHFANYVATTLSNSLFLNYRSIVEARIPHERLVELHNRNPESTRLIWFDQVDYPGVDKLALAGPSLMDTSMYDEALKHGKIWYIVYATREGGRIYGLTRNCVVTAFSRISESDFLDYVVRDVLPLIE